MEERVPIIFKIQPVLRILPVRKLCQEEQRMQKHPEEGTGESGRGFSSMLAAERRRVEAEDMGRTQSSGSYGKDAREIAEYVSSYDFRR